VSIAGQDVDYRLFRARRSSIGMVIDHSGLVVRAPRWVALREIETALIERADWVIRTLAEWRGKNRDSLPTQWRAGAALLYQGRQLTLALFPARRKAIAADLLHLTVLHPDPGDENEIAAFVGRWLKDQALALLSPRVAHFASRVVQEAPRGRSVCIGAWCSCRRGSPITSSRTKSRTWSNSITRRASGRCWRRCCPAMTIRGANSTR
jgi:predicted metal-dependent hydrolase